MTKFPPIRTITNNIERVTFALCCTNEIQPEGSMLTAIAIATSNCPIFAMTDDDGPISIAICSLPLPGLARRLRFIWTVPGYRGKGHSLALARHVARSAPHVGVAVRSKAERRLAKRAGFTHWRRVPGEKGHWAGATTIEAFELKFAHPEPTPALIADALRAFSAAQLQVWRG
ncbi:GNAT family N-acetyltransferase [Microvirga sp. TS319]|uniref:GNAT family N-acetyltransferase n=1 Tax=Microvirga sp. TS319 TaxID=3241165 RepID=UPI00351A1165